MLSLALIPFLLTATKANEQPIVFLRDHFTGDAQGWVLTDINRWEVVDDKKDGAKDEASLSTKISYASLFANCHEDGLKTIRVMIRLRADNSADAIVEGERFEIRLYCNSGNGERYMYFLFIQQDTLSLSLSKEDENGKYNSVVKDKRMENVSGRDSQYHTYILELADRGMTRVYRDGELAGEKNFGDLDFATKRAHHDLDFTIKKVGFVFITPKEHGNRWCLDEIEIASVPETSGQR